MAEKVGDGEKIKAILGEIFEIMDKNKDGKIDCEEGKAVGMAMGETEERAAASWVGITNDMDTDKNTAVEQAEWVGYYCRTLTEAPLEAVLTKLGEMKEKMAAGVAPTEVAPDPVVAAAVADAPAPPAPAGKNSAFVFIKPHAVTEKCKELVKAGLEAKKLTILTEGSISSEDIDAKQLIDKHYNAIASKATLMKPSELNVPEDKFKEKFGLEWKDALAGGRVFNAKDACDDLGITPDEMDTQWGICKKAEKLIKFGGGFYCGLIEIEGKEPAHVFNGFFMSMRNKFTAPGLSIYYYVVEWATDELSWADFRGQVLGPTDPKEAPADSLRGKILSDWEALGLTAEPNVGDNGVHASASPFEAMSERNNWLEATLEDDPYGASLLAAKIDKKWIEDGCVDPQVTLEDGSKGSLFDAVEDLDSAPCTEKLVKLAAL
jgi:nucleoside diphosphate kinase